MVNNFLISPIFSETAKVLDNKRLGKQRVETFQIINILDRKNKKTNKRVGFVNHPAVKAWEGHSDALKQYCNAMLEEWESRGFNNNMKYYPVKVTVDYPKWIYCEKIHMSHKARLVQKDHHHYAPLFPDVLDTEYMKLGYIWPSKWTLDQLKTLPVQDLAEPLPHEQRCVHAVCAYRASVLTTSGWSCKIHAKGLELVDNTCTAQKKDGSFCQNKRKYDELCGVHRVKKAEKDIKGEETIKEEEPEVTPKMKNQVVTKEKKKIVTKKDKGIVKKKRVVKKEVVLDHKLS